MGSAGLGEACASCSSSSSEQSWRSALRVSSTGFGAAACDPKKLDSSVCIVACARDKRRWATRLLPSHLPHSSACGSHPFRFLCVQRPVSVVLRLRVPAAKDALHGLVLVSHIAAVRDPLELRQPLVALDRVGRHDDVYARRLRRCNVQATLVDRLYLGRLDVDGPSRLQVGFLRARQRWH